MRSSLESFAREMTRTAWAATFALTLAGCAELLDLDWSPADDPDGGADSSAAAPWLAPDAGGSSAAASAPATEGSACTTALDCAALDGPCLRTACIEHRCAREPEPEGAPCGPAGSMRCDGAGACVALAPKPAPLHSGTTPAACTGPACGTCSTFDERVARRSEADRNAERPACTPCAAGERCASDTDSVNGSCHDRDGDEPKAESKHELRAGDDGDETFGGEEDGRSGHRVAPSIDRSVDPSIDPSVIRSIDRSVSPSIDRSVNPSEERD